jgi:hypothetical protein
MIMKRLTHYKKAPRLRGSRKLAIPFRGILAERSLRSRVRFAAKNALLTAAGRSAHSSAKKEWRFPERRARFAAELTEGPKIVNTFSQTVEREEWQCDLGEKSAM